MKCGHPDVMENLYWTPDRTRISGLGGAWRCRACNVANATQWNRQHGYVHQTRYRDTLGGILAGEKSHIRHNAKRRGAA
jgi:hypothetical protein